MKKPDSESKYYVQSIPKSFAEFPIFYLSKERKLIKNSLLENAIKDDENDINNIFEILTETKLKGQYTKKDVKNAYIAVRSRNFLVYLKNERKLLNVLVPFVDLFNYDPMPNTVWTQKLEDENDSFFVKANKSIPQGQQIFLDYGKDDNELLLTGYGFTLEHNPFPLSSNYFSFNYKGKMENLRLKETNIKDIISFAIDNSKTKILNKDNIRKIRKNEAKLYEKILRELKTFSNKKRLKYLKENLNETPNSLDIYRALKAEDSLIDKNIKFLKNIINILKEGTKTYEANLNKKIVKQNQKYFQDLFSY